MVARELNQLFGVLDEICLGAYRPICFSTYFAKAKKAYVSARTINQLCLSKIEVKTWNHSTIALGIKTLCSF